MDFGRVVEIPEGPKRTAALAAWVQALYPAGVDRPALVGGAAVELYTGGAYATGDLDFVGEVPSKVASSLRAAGFRKDGRHWVCEAHQIFIEFPASLLSADEERALIKVGRVDITTIRPEDVLLDRLRSLVFWKHWPDGVNAFLVAWAQRRALDQAYAEKRAREPELLAALKELFDLIELSAPRKPTRVAVDRWVRGVLR